jgi:hypothetical protein
MRTYNTRSEAEVAQGVLSANKIASVIEGYSAIWPEPSGIKLLVAHEDLPKAVDMLVKSEVTR